MSRLDWILLSVFFLYTLWDGIRQNRKTNDVSDHLLAGRNMQWWAIGISVLATQASAITFIGTTGQAFMFDMRFIQVYLGMPVAMVILCVTLVPFYYKLKAYTAYENLEQRFGLSVRLATSLLFMLSRGITVGISIIAPAYVLAWALELPLSQMILVIGISTTVYTLFGGMAGVLRTDMKQMALMLLGLVMCFVWILIKLPEEISFGDALHLAGAAGKLDTINFSFDPGEKYNIWSGLFAGLFLMLSYFGADQSQVQRYLTARSLRDARISLLFPAIVKLPMQFFILLLGAMLYIFFLFAERPLLFTPDYSQEKGATWQSNEVEFQSIHKQRRKAAVDYIRLGKQETEKKTFKQLDQRAGDLRKRQIRSLEKETGQRRDDTNYVLPYFILQEMPSGVMGLIIAAILAATLSSIDSMLNSLAAVSIIDGYKRLQKREKSPAHYLGASRLATAFWGIVATGSALIFGETESIIELINKVGSYFYGTILGVFILYWIRPATGRSVLLGLLAGFIAVIFFDSLYQHNQTCDFALFLQCPGGYEKSISYLWLNPIGTIAALTVGVLAGKWSK